jgi:hypothetical protein
MVTMVPQVRVTDDFQMMTGKAGRIPPLGPITYLVNGLEVRYIFRAVAGSAFQDFPLGGIAFPIRRDVQFMVTARASVIAVGSAQSAVGLVREHDPTTLVFHEYARAWGFSGFGCQGIARKSRQSQNTSGDEYGNGTLAQDAPPPWKE